ncbi:MAG TPA: hypothetical protein VIJ35_00495, partial [Bradyrhizobium sp.]
YCFTLPREMLECEFASDLASLSRGWLRGLLAGFNRCFELAILAPMPLPVLAAESLAPPRDARGRQR